MDLDITRQLVDVPDLRHRIRQLRWFKTSFRHHARLVAQHYSLSFEIDDSKLTAAFLNWAEAFDVSRSYARLDRRDFVTFSAGLLLRELIRAHPVVASSIDGQPSASRESWVIAHHWPEGFLSTNYCLCVMAAVLEQEGMSLTLPALADDLRTWSSYRENAEEDPSQAVGFLDLLLGNQPNWLMPDSVASRNAMKRAIAAGVLPGGDRV